MPHSEELAQRVRAELLRKADVEEKKMFGGLAFMVGGQMTLGVDRDDLIVRCEKDETEDLLAAAGVRIFDLSGRPMKGWLLVGPVATANIVGLRRWIARALAWRAAQPHKAK